MSIRVCLISRMNFNYKEKVEGKAFLAKSNHQCRVSQRSEHDCSAHKKSMEIIMRIQV